jgi:hypothetical protein
MDPLLERALDFSNYQHTLAIQRKTLKEKMSAKLVCGFSGGIFTVTRELLVFVQMLIDQKRTSGVIVLDNNENPILIDDLEKFRDELFDKYFTVTLEYHQHYENIKKSRSVEKLLNV